MQKFPDEGRDSFMLQFRLHVVHNSPDGSERLREAPVLLFATIYTHRSLNLCLLVRDCRAPTRGRGSQ
jgi:hypothetical protein